MSGSAGTSSTSSTLSGPARAQHPLEAVTSVVRQAPGATAVKGVVDGVVGGVRDTVGVVTPHARRVAAYAGEGLLGAAGAAMVWLTQPLRRGDTSAEVRPATARAERPQPKPAAKRATGRRTAAKRATPKPTAPKPAAKPATGPAATPKAAKPKAATTAKTAKAAKTAAKTTGRTTAGVPRRTGSTPTPATGRRPSGTRRTASASPAAERAS